MYRLIFHFGSLQILITHDQTFIMPNFTLHGFAETILTPLQASSVLIKVVRQRATLNPPLPPITKEEIMQGELSSLLIEEDYNLSTMVS